VNIARRLIRLSERQTTVCQRLSYNAA